MLWYKGWLETRWRLAFAIGFLLAVPTIRYLGPAGSVPVTNSPLPLSARQAGLLNIWVAFWVMPPLILAGSGIKTQSPFQASKGLHGSMQFTLAMPVTRVRLLSVRAMLGLLELAATTVAGSWGVAMVLPQFGLQPTLGTVLQYALAVFTCTIGIYFVSVLLATMLDDLWQFWGSAILLGLLRWSIAATPLPKSVDFFRAMGEGSPFVTHTLPWEAMCGSLGLAVILFFTALKIVQTREY